MDEYSEQERIALEANEKFSSRTFDRLRYIEEWDVCELNTEEKSILYDALTSAWAAVRIKKINKIGL